VAVCRALIAAGAHVTTHAVGYGDARPVVIGGTPVDRAANRRVVIFIDS
jgi:flagellar motor protein MotB